MKYGLSPKTIEKLCGVLAAFPEIDRAVVYGSRAIGNYKNGSDIDLTLFGPKLTQRSCASVAEAIDDLMLPYTVDLSVFSLLEHLDLEAHIQRVGLEFYCRPNADATGMPE
jgi:uncharacterized protein